MILVQNFHLQIEPWGKMLLFLELMCELICTYLHTYNKNKDILIIGEGPTQGLDDTTLTAEAKCPIYFT